MTGEEPTWAVLAPLHRKELNKLVEQYYRDVAKEDPGFDEDEELELEPATWEIIGGTGNYSAIVDYDPGADETDEGPLATRISRKVKLPVYVLYLSEYMEGGDAVEVYEKGKRTGSQGGPYALAKKLGVDLPGSIDTDEEDELPRVVGVLVVKGVKAPDVARALRKPYPLPKPLILEDGPHGAILYNEETGNKPTVNYELSKAFPKAEVYSVKIDPDEGRFLTSLMQNGKEKGWFDFPKPADPDQHTVLDSILGETTPAAIVKALGIPSKILDVSDL